MSLLPEERGGIMLIEKTPCTISKGATTLQKLGGPIWAEPESMAKPKKEREGSEEGAR